MKHVVIALALTPLAAQAGLIVEDDGPQPTVVAEAPAAQALAGQSVPAAPVQPVVVPVERWSISSSDGTLRQALSKWASRVGWQVIWEAPVDIPVTATASFEGDFKTAVRAVFSSLSAADVNLAALMYTGNQVLRVTEAGRRAQ
ncbi:toxin co-regulated pilus biosynthesis Q family protein [Ralstonia thomasii]|uniref:Toxin co-regulated pilus biosynthesis protein Q C-terminal domain-containing protein n=2 Tax=Ralstonia TaxID=48736 RepID=A0AAD2F650_9RALS|nr:toxin co-regulated pilus biosynthesis Q family protein [Ralstonia sp. LMG 18095]NMV39893.1 hypothetical protein [Ralstonia insidiosa]CAJ0808602.1 hypothetical protein R77560_04749 [Ralstonia sp. LMG 18095]